MLELTIPAADTGTRRAAGRPAGWSHPAVALGTLGAAVSFAGSWIPSYWGDEAASVLSADRSLPSLAGVLGQIDAVHGLYYVALHFWTSLFGTSELATRLPSALAVGLMVAGTATLGRQLSSRHVAWIAGAVALLLPRATSMGIEARSYALGTAAAVWVTVLLIALLRRDRGRGWWVGYAAAVAGCMYLFLYLGLVLLVHAAFVALFHRDRMRRWLRAAGLAAALALPILLLGFLQRNQISFLSHRNYATATNVLVRQWFGNPVLAGIAWSLILIGIATVAIPLARRIRSDWGRVQLTSFAAVWLVLPPALLLLGNAVSPMYNVRYLSFCTPAAALLIALGITAGAGFVAPRWRMPVAAALVAGLAAAAAPAYLAQRTPWAKDGGSDWRAVAEYIAANAAPGDAVVFDQTTRPSRDPRLALDLYGADFAAVRDVALVTPAADRAWLWDEVAPNADLGPSILESPDVWAVELASRSAIPADVRQLERLGYTLQSVDLIHRTTVFHLAKE